MKLRGNIQHAKMVICLSGRYDMKKHFIPLHNFFLFTLSQINVKLKE